MDDARLVEVLAVQTAVLEELAAELAEDGLHDKAEWIRSVIERALRSDEESVWKVKTLVIFLRPLHYELEKTNHKLHVSIRNVRRHLAHEVDMYQRRKYAPRVPRRFGSGEWKPPKA